jgi:tetratricopeptide (TPR) repeat protein
VGILLRVLFLFFCLFSVANSQQVSSSISPDGLIEAGHWKRARQALDVRLRQNPNDAYALYLRSKVAASFGDLDEAQRLAERAVALEGHSADFLGQAAEIYARQADRASIVKQVLYLRKYKHALEAALAINPRHVDTMLVDIMFLWRAPAFAGGDKTRARERADQLARIHPMWGNLVQARMAEEAKDDQWIERSLRKAVEAAPSSYFTRVSLASYYCCTAARAKPELAEQLARQAMRMDPGQAGAYDVLARVYAGQQRWTELDSILRQAEQAVADDLAPFYRAASVLANSGADLTRAERYLRKYLTQETEGREPTKQQCRQLLAAVAGSSSVGQNRRGVGGQREVQVAVDRREGLGAAEFELPVPVLGFQVQVGGTRPVVEGHDRIAAAVGVGRIGHG